MAKYTRIALIFILALAIVLSCTVAGRKLTDPATYAHTIEVLDRNRSTVLGLSSAAAAASSAVSALPDDTCSPMPRLHTKRWSTWTINRCYITNRWHFAS